MTPSSGSQLSDDTFDRDELIRSNKEREVKEGKKIILDFAKEEAENVPSQEEKQRIRDEVVKRAKMFAKLIDEHLKE